MTDDPRDSNGSKRWRVRFGLKSLLALTGFFAIMLFVTLPILSNERFAELTVIHQTITDDNLVQISCETTMARDSYLALTCPVPTIAAGDAKLKIPGWPDRRDFHYLGQLDPALSKHELKSLNSGFVLQPGDKVRLDPDSPEIDIYRIVVDGKSFTMTLRLSNRPS